MEDQSTSVSEALGDIAIGDYARVVQGMFVDDYATVKNESYGDRWRYFSEKTDRSHGKYWVLKDNYVDSRPISDLTKVEPRMNWEGHFVFN